MSTSFTHAASCLCGQEPLRPEGSVPVSGFSKELRLSASVERYWFSFALRGEITLPVHLVFSASARVAEIKAADLKAYRVENVDSPCVAREQWLVWWRTSRPASSRAYTGPRRTGRAPRLLHASS
ncbi:MAG TPA: hypothetical protein VGH97_03760 [Thermoanaerobaculia bacterium]|jgi:hypothetical protein